jgi:urea transporter/murein DD-endopeptidase MepM/ murein hydrolase activator NlpD
MKTKTWFSQFISGVLNSYSQVFFSEHRVFALIILLVTFFDLFAGLSGLIAVLLTLFFGNLIGLNRNEVYRGIYGFNSLLVGLGLGIYFEPGGSYFLMLILATLLTLLLSVTMEGVIGKYSLPYLSVPFILAIWITTLATRQFEALGISDRGIYTLNDLYILGGNKLVTLYEWWNNISIPSSIKVYFLSLGAILFQFNVLSGLVIAIGLLYYSRIGFTLSLLGFYTAYIFYELAGANLSELNYSYIGFNYILTSIAIGGFFIIPSKSSYLWTVVLIPLVAILTTSLNTLFTSLGLPIYSLPFNIMVLMFLYVIKFRVRHTGNLQEVVIQQNTPEKNLYSFQNRLSRFGKEIRIPFRLPFWGEWTVSQGHSGEYTHKENWRYAWDFVIKDNSGKEFKNKGDHPEDYYCYGKDVLAPADGVIEAIEDGVEDNMIGEVDTLHNWGNTVVIKHLDFLFSKMSHLKEGSIKVKEGDKVKQGEILGRSGNSGRSPYPHLHFQFQATPYIGSATLYYPFGYYIQKKNGISMLKSFEIPKEEEQLSNIQVDSLLKNAFNLIPGKRLTFSLKQNGGGGTIQDWVVQTNIYNRSYIWCEQSNSYAYFQYDGSIFYFTHFEGSHSSLLYYFYLALYKVQLGFYQDLSVEDLYPTDHLVARKYLFLHDFIAPFISLLKARYRITYVSVDNKLTPSKIVLSSTAETWLRKRLLKRFSFTIHLGVQGIQSIEGKLKNKQIEAVCID